MFHFYFFSVLFLENVFFRDIHQDPFLFEKKKLPKWMSEVSFFPRFFRPFFKKLRNDHGNYPENPTPTKGKPRFLLLKN